MRREGGRYNLLAWLLLLGGGFFLIPGQSLAASKAQDSDFRGRVAAVHEIAQAASPEMRRQKSQPHFVYEIARRTPEHRRPGGGPHFIYEIAQVATPENRRPRGGPRFVYEIATRGQYFETLLAGNETSEVTILLERKTGPRSAAGAEEPPSADSEGLGGVSGTPDASQPMDESGPTEDVYEELEDPFAVAGDEVPVVDDPFESYNRFMFDVNEGIYDYFMEPVARGYRWVLHEDVRIIITNLFDNVAAPVKLVSSLIQGDLAKSGRVLGRFLINSTAGLGGMFDVAGQEYDIENPNEDMGQALGKIGVPTGPYIVLPFFGPSTARSAVGLGMDSLLSPSFLFGAPFAVGAGVTVGEGINEVSFIIEDKESLEESAIDEYESVRDFYLQYRENLLKE
ncbi:MAG: VacJ family lipoprotein [Nitrospinaceae bacterium]|nr:MAG: VacJ family lipoprotein [Nitrospinaceae bacterium]